MRKFILGDCMSEENGLPTYPDKFFDLAIVDPPYGIGAHKAQGNGGGRCKKWLGGEWDIRPDKRFFIELFRVSKDQIIWGANYFTDMLPPSMGWIFWDKGQRVATSDGELAFSSFNRALRVAEYSRSKMQGFMNPTRFHPTEKPVALYRWLLENYAKPGQLILDTHVGSASSLIACESMGFDYVGFEIDPDYYAAAKNRMSKGIQAVLI